MSPKELTRAQVLRTARRFRSSRKRPKWTVLVENREHPARPLVLAAAGVAPNDPTNSHQAVAILEGLGFETRYHGAKSASMQRRRAKKLAQGGLDRLTEKLLEIATKIPQSEWDRLPRDLSKNADHYLYGSPKAD